MTPVDHEDTDVSSTDRPDTRPGVWSERIVVGLLVACLAGTLNLIIVLHRRNVAPAPDPSATPTVVVAVPASAVTAATPPPEIVQVPKVRKIPEATRPLLPVEDPTKKALAELETATARELEEIKKADLRTEAMEKGRQAAVAESARWRRRETLIRSQVATLNEKSQQIAQEVDAATLERDALARERDALKAALTMSNTNSSFAVLPFKGANGTWQRPIVLECENGSVTLQPRGLNFSMLDLNPHIHPKASIVVQTIARELTVMETAGSPDGAPVVPYLVFVVRPDGIRAYYEARARLEPLGISFGYELVPQDLKINFPDLADLETWDGKVPLDVPSHLKGNGSDPSSGGADPSMPPPVGGGDLALNGKPGAGWPEKGTAGDAWGSGSKANGGEGDSPNDFIWPSRPGGGQGYGKEMGDALAGSRNRRDGGFSASAPGAGGRGFGTPSADRGGFPSGRSGNAGRDASGSGSGNGGSPGVWATPGDGSSDRPNQGAGGSQGFRSRGAPGVDANGSPFGFELPGTSRGVPGGSNGSSSGGTGNPPQGDLADLLEKTPGINSGGGLGSLINDWTGNDRGGSNSGTGTGAGNTGSYELNGKGGSGPSASGLGRGSSGTARTSQKSGKMPSTPGGSGDDSASGAEPGSNTDPSSPVDPSGGFAASSGSRNPSSSMSGLSSSLLQSQPTDGTGSTADGSSSSSDGSSSSSGSSSGSQGTSRSLSSSSSSGVGFALPSSLSPSSSSPGSSSGSSSSSSSPSSKSTDISLDDLPPLPEPERKEPLRIDAPFEVVIDCQRDGIEILPGGNRITMKTMQAKGAMGEQGHELLTRHLRWLERKRAIVDPMIRPRPRVKFIVEAGGDATYLAVRRQLLFSGLDWPMSVQMVDGHASRFFTREVW